MAWCLELATSFAYQIAGQQWTACQTAEAKDWAGTCCGSCCHMLGLPWHSSDRIPCCLDQTSEVATSGWVAVADVAVVVGAGVAVALVALDHTVT